MASTVEFNVEFYNIEAALDASLESSKGFKNAKVLMKGVANPTSTLTSHRGRPGGSRHNCRRENVVRWIRDVRVADGGTGGRGPRNGSDSRSRSGGPPTAPTAEPGRPDPARLDPERGRSLRARASLYDVQYGPARAAWRLFETSEVQSSGNVHCVHTGGVEKRRTSGARRASVRRCGHHIPRTEGFVRRPVNTFWQKDGRIELELNRGLKRRYYRTEAGWCILSGKCGC